MGWLRNIVDKLDPPPVAAVPNTPRYGAATPVDAAGARTDARNRLKLVLMHDRTQLSPAVMEQMRDELVEVISKFVEIDKDALELNLESENSNTIALVANIPVVRARNLEATGPADKAQPETPVTAAGPNINPTNPG